MSALNFDDPNFLQTLEWQEKVLELKLEIRRKAVQQCDALIDAGWRFELPEIVNNQDGKRGDRETEPWQWYWRRPPRRRGSKGMKFYSTNQAYTHLRKTKPELPEVYS